MNDACPTCGSDCNERDELIKAEREIEKLTQERDEARAEQGRLTDALIDAQTKECEARASEAAALVECDALRADLGWTRAECERLRAENAALSAWQCIHHDGKTGLTHDEGGNASCAKDAKIALLQEMVALLRDQVGLRADLDARMAARWHELYE